MHFPQAINSDISVLIVCNKIGGTIKGDIKKYILFILFALVTKKEASVSRNYPGVYPVFACELHAQTAVTTL